MKNQPSGIFQKAKKTLSSVNGQGLVEYALILVLIAIVVIGAVRSVGQTANNTFTTINNDLNK